MTPIPLLLTLAVAQPQALTLDDALAEAARSNQPLRAARVASASAANDLYGSYAGVLPRLDLSASWGRDFVGARRSVQVVPVIDPAAGAFSGFDRRVVSTPSRDESDYSVGLTLRQPIFDGLASWRNIEAAQAGARAAERQLDERGLALAFDVTRRFYDAVKADESVRVLEETVRRSEEVLAREQALFEAGRAPKSDVIAARVNLENDRISVENQRVRAGEARANLALALGRADASADDLRAVPPATVTGAVTPELEPPPSAALLDRARTRRPLLAASRELVTQAERSAAAARGAFWPVLAVQASYNRSGPELAGTEGVYGNPGRQYVATAQLVLSWNLFAGRETTASARRAAFAAERSALDREQAESQVAAEVVAARAAAAALARATAISQAALAAAEEGQQAARARFEVGVANQLEVRDAELKLTQARLALLNARVDQAVARADLARATGGPLE